MLKKTKHCVNDIQKKCMNVSSKDQANIQELRRLKIMKMQQSKGPAPIGSKDEGVECMEPTMQEIANIKEELEREMKLDKIFV